MSPLSAAERGCQAASDIRRAFAEVPRPAPDAIATRTSAFLKYEDEEGRLVERFFAGRDWRDMTFQVIWDGCESPGDAALTFMAPEAFRYFLPAYILIALEEYDISDVTAETAILGLIPDRLNFTGNADDPGSWFGRNVGGFTDEQRRAIAGFLLAMQEAYGQDFSQDSSPMAALERYWARFLPDEDRPLVGRVKGYSVNHEKAERLRRLYSM